MGTLITGVIALACVFGGALVGMFFRKRVPDEYQGSDSKDLVRLVMGLVVTTVALALGLLVGSAKSFYDTQNAEMAQLGAKCIMLDRILAYYGPETADARAELRSVLGRQLEMPGRLMAPKSAIVISGRVFKLPTLSSTKLRGFLQKTTVNGITSNRA